MAKFLPEKELYPLIQKKSAEAKEEMWVCTPYLGSGAHEIFSQNVTRSPPKDIRFVFKLNQNSVNRREVDPLEMEYFLQHFKNSSIRVDNTFHSKIYIFDNSALVTSANLSKTAFGKNIEAGVLLQHNQAEEAKRFFERLWRKAKRVPNLNEYKTIWNATNSKRRIHSDQDHVSRSKPHTKIISWNDDNAESWLFVTSEFMSDRTKEIIEKETNWNEMEILSDLSHQTYSEVKLGDIIYICDISDKLDRTVEIQEGRVKDKRRIVIPNGGGNYHIAYEEKQTKRLRRNLFDSWRDKVKIPQGDYERLLDDLEVGSLKGLIASKK